jgi:putative AdoMet-dependent methyltransferase
MAENAKRQALFDRWSMQYDQDVYDGEFPFIGYDRTLSALSALGEFSDAHHVLDVGIGTGNLAVRLPIPPEQIWGIDFSNEMLSKAAKALPGSHLLQVDLLTKDWPVEIAHPYDRIVSGYTFHEFPDETKVTLLNRLAAELLAPDGKILIADISFPDVTLMEEARTRFVSEGRWDEEEYYWCAETMLAMLSGQGFLADYLQTSPCSGVYCLSPR